MKLMLDEENLPTNVLDGFLKVRSSFIRLKMYFNFFIYVYIYIFMYIINNEIIHHHIKHYYYITDL